MKNSRILSLLIVAGVGLGAASGLYYFWHQLTQLPDWYAQTETNPKSHAQIQQSGAAVEQKIAATVQASSEPSSLIPNSSATVDPTSDQTSRQKSDIKVALNSEELNALLVTKITQKSGGRPLPNSIKGFHTAVQNNTLKTGAVVDVKELQSSGIASQQQEFLSEITQKFPMSNRQVYIGVEGKPKVQDGKLRFDQTAKIQVGNLSFTIAEVADRLGVPPETVQDQLNVEMQLRGLDVQDIDLQDGNAILRGTAK